MEGGGGRGVEIDFWTRRKGIEADVEWERERERYTGAGELRTKRRKKTSVQNVHTC